MKLLLVPLAIVAFVLFLLVLGAIGLAISFAVIYAVGGIWRLLSSGGLLISRRGSKRRS